MKYIQMKTVFSMIGGIGLILLFINFFGLFKTLRVQELYNEKLMRFGADDIQIEFPMILDLIKKNTNESDYEFALRLNQVIPKGLAHIEWDKIEDSNQYYQRIPIWENYFLYALSFSPWFDDFKRYHYRSYKKSLERGIGICGDAAMILSGILQEHGIKARIVAFTRGHVINEVFVDQHDASWFVFDPDFGVVLPFSIQDLSANPNKMRMYYKNSGYSEKEMDVLEKIYSGPYKTFENVKAFGPTTLLIENLSYILKWVMPVFCIAIYYAIILRKKTIENFD